MLAHLLFYFYSDLWQLSPSGQPPHEPPQEHERLPFFLSFTLLTIIAKTIIAIKSATIQVDKFIQTPLFFLVSELYEVV